MGKLYEQLTSGKQVSSLSDAPLVVSRVLRAHNALAELDSRRAVISAAELRLGATDGALDSIGDALQRCHDISLRAMTSSLDDSERTALAAEVRQLGAVLMDAGNASAQGNYVFAGTRYDTAPFQASSFSGLPVAYAGSLQALSYQISPAQTVPVGLTGAEVFNYPDATGERPLGTVDADVFALLDDLADSIEQGDLDRAGQLSDQVQACYEHVVGLRGRVGTVAQRCELASEACDSSETRLRELLASDEDLDMAAAITDLSTEETAYEAVLGMTSRLLALPNLFEASW
jgi:flagellar hook-associated protein 3 FlgL